MAPRRDTRQQRLPPPPQQQQHPPPPYDTWRASAGHSPLAERELVSPVFERVGQQQTIPKSTTSQPNLDHETTTTTTGAANAKAEQHFKQRLVVAGGSLEPPDGRRRRSINNTATTTNNSGDGNNQAAFISSLAAPKSSLFRHVSVEPLAFLAIMALYVEFPAIQDLIYTKICLEVVASHANTSSSSSSSSSSSQWAVAPIATSTTPAPLPGNGRIQELVVSRNQSAFGAPAPVASPTNESAPVPQLFSSPNLHLACDRLNRTAAPAAVRQEIADANALFWLKYQLLVCVLCALCSPYWGGLSDRIGRVLPINVTIVAATLCNAISLAFGLLISLDSHASVHINWLYAGALLVGVTGGQQVLIINAFSFISDHTSSEERSKRVTVLEAVICLAHSAGFFLSKLIMPLGLAGPGEIWLNRHCVSFATCIALNLVCLLYSSCRLRHRKFHKFLNNFERQQQEAAAAAATATTTTAATRTVRPMGVDNLAASSGSMAAIATAGKAVPHDNDELTLAAAASGSCDRLHRELTSNTPDDPDGPIARSDRSNWSVWETLVTFRYYRQTYEIATKARETRPIILLLLLLGFLSALSLTALFSLLFSYVRLEPFNWPTSQYSSWNANSAVTRGLAMVALTLAMRFVAGWRVPDALVAAIGFAGKGAGLLMIGLANSTTLIDWSLLPLTLSEFSMPPIRSLLSKLVQRDELGKLYSCLGALQSLCFILGNLVFYLALTSFVQRHLYRLVFVTVGALELLALIVVLLVHTAIRRQILTT